MKKILILLSLLMIFVCSCENTETISNSVSLYELEVTLGAPRPNLPEPVKTLEAPSCHYEGTDTVYYYEDFTLYTYRFEDKDVVYCIELLNDNTKTREGAKVGMTQSDIVGIYGQEYETLPNGISYPLETGGSLNFRIKDDKVFMIEYYTE